MTQAVVTIKVYFDWLNGLWLTDGNPADTQSLGSVSSFNPGGFTLPADAVSSNGTLFFGAGGRDNYNLWSVVTQFDGSLTPEGPVSGEMFGEPGDGVYTVHDAFPSNLIFVNGFTFFDTPSIPAIVLSGQQPDYGLWATNGTFYGTGMVQHLDNGLDPFIAPYGPMVNINGTLFFVGYTSVQAVDATGSATGLGYELYETNAPQTLALNSDGTLNFSGVTTTLVKDIDPGAGSSLPRDLTAIGNTLFFSADDGTNGRQLWKTDGTTIGTVMVADINPGEGAGFDPLDLVNDNGTLLFFATDGTHGYQLWSSDGTAAGTVMLTSVDAAGGGIFPLAGTQLTIANGPAYFIADDGTDGPQLWKSDGTAAGTTMVTDINPGEGAGHGLAATALIAAGSRLFFAADDGVHGSQLWTSDGSAAGTVMVTDINPGAPARDSIRPFSPQWDPRCISSPMTGSPPSCGSRTAPRPEPRFCRASPTSIRQV